MSFVVLLLIITLVLVELKIRDTEFNKLMAAQLCLPHAITK